MFRLLSLILLALLLGSSVAAAVDDTAPRDVVCVGSVLTWTQTSKATEAYAMRLGMAPLLTAAEAGADSARQARLGDLLPGEQVYIWEQLAPSRHAIYGPYSCEGSWLFLPVLESPAADADQPSLPEFGAP